MGMVKCLIDLFVGGLLNLKQITNNSEILLAKVAFVTVTTNIILTNLLWPLVQ